MEIRQLSENLENCRYALDISTVPRKDLSWQGLVGGDNNRTPVIFQVSDNLVFVGDERKIIVQFSYVISK